MGIERFFGTWILKNYKQVISKDTPRNVSSLLLDMNGIFHKAAQKIYGYGTYDDKAQREKNEDIDPDILSKEHIKEIIKMINDLVRTLKPKDNFVLAPDGIANAGKISQQKGRRYKKVKDDVLNIPFDSNCLTPGTEFMRELDEALKEWLLLNKNILPTRVIYSSHLVPGEGEHKIFEYIRDSKLIEGNGDNVVYGMDADLIILSLLSPGKRIKLMRESLNEVMDIDVLKEIIVDELRFPKYNRELLIKDFSVLVMFVGNDFLPKFPSFIGTNDMMQHIFKVYKHIKRHITTHDNNINWKGFLNLLYIYEKGVPDEIESELELFKSIVKTPPTFPYPEIEKVSKTENGEIQFNMKIFNKYWYCKQFCPRSNKLAKLYSDSDIKNFYNMEDVKKMCIKFLKTMNWVLVYYVEGHKKVDSLFFYGYKYTPMINHVISILGSIIKNKEIDILNDIRFKEGQREISALDQLMMVLPPQSISLIPKKFQSVYIEKLGPFSPINFEVIVEGAHAEWQGIPLIPPINPMVVFDAVDNSGIRFPPELKKEKEAVLESVIKKVEIRPVFRGRGRGGRNQFIRGRGGRGRGGRGRGRGRGGGNIIIV